MWARPARGGCTNALDLCPPPPPRSAEATDIANAVLDGVDAIMLGAETYRGNYALETVQTGGAGGGVCVCVSVCGGRGGGVGGEVVV